jgi:hypothetical protein
MAIRFRTRFMQATLTNHIRDGLAELGWSGDDVNFGTTPVTVVDYQPDERDSVPAQNTVAVTLGDVPESAEEELGGASGGLSSVDYVLFVDAYMAEQALSVAIADDIRDLLEYQYIDLIDQITGQPVPGTRIGFEETLGPQRPDGAGSDNFRRHWRVVKSIARLYYRT